MFASEDSAENGGMRSKEEIRKIVEGFAKSGMTRREYCAKHGVAMTTLDYWRRAHRKQKPKLVQVAIEEARAAGWFRAGAGQRPAHRELVEFRRG